MSASHEAPFPQLRSAYLRAIARAWRDETYFRKLLETSRTDDRGALPMLERDFNFTFPFDVKFAINDVLRPVWRPIGSGGWFGFADRFDIALPARPRDPADGAAVLARYCAEFPSLLGKATKADPYSTAPPDFAEFGVITSRLIALTWYEPAFAAALFAAPDGRALVQDALDFVVSWNFTIKFTPAPGESSDTDGYWCAFPRSAITVHLPENPGRVEVEPVALAAYNDTGGQYPFTCG
ncbi:MAG: BMA_0021/BMA_0022 family TOMM bacteriocin [Polyangiaceae bacterium]|jgi:ribosomally synthesized peptide (two-chain TOMM family)|nr:BMA_0021/BMA_0022 family TOMM bacteriocin [Polyangiaceae bacterium]